MSEAKVIEDVKFFDSLLNGHHDTNILDTWAPFVPDYSGLDSFLSAA